MGANSRLGAYSNKYGTLFPIKTIRKNALDEQFTEKEVNVCKLLTIDAEKARGDQLESY